MKQTETKKFHGQGICPKCGSMDLEYGISELEGDWLFYEFECNNCRATGKEWYKCVYSESILNDDI